MSEQPANSNGRTRAHDRISQNGPRKTNPNKFALLILPITLFGYAVNCFSCLKTDSVCIRVASNPLEVSIR